MDITTIQEIIDQRAEKRLTKDLDKMRDTILSIPIFLNTSMDFPKLRYGKNEMNPYWFFNSDHEYYKALYKYLLPLYKTEEAQILMAGFDQFQESQKHNDNDY